ncbi:hypothetical protein LG201_07425 [Methylobacillus gramineus]|uniref:hypothetical protein n=1 Tax=Methylobacillus gramineus TaxID=755169 RepID=UPI001D000C1D|nr:hypothetical protein [Methylobacillus gramineus]MCB5185032.1 hypothetical protein [Methylobacillus gramineus]
MAIFTIDVHEKKIENKGDSLWRTSINAADIEEAYRIGKSQFEMERPDLNAEDVVIEASSESVEK